MVGGRKIAALAGFAGLLKQACNFVGLVFEPANVFDLLSDLGVGGVKIEGFIVDIDGVGLALGEDRLFGVGEVLSLLRRLLLAGELVLDVSEELFDLGVLGIDALEVDQQWPGG